MDETLPRKCENYEQKRKILGRYQRGESMNSIAQKCSVCGRTIGRWLDIWNEKKRTRAEQIHLAKTNTFQFTNHHIEVLEGELLGDGSLIKYPHRPLADYCFALNNTVKNHCLLVKEELPGPLFATGSPWYATKHGQWAKQGQWVLKSRSHPSLTELEDIWYRDRIKVVPESLTLTRTVLYFWYIGDGGLVARSNIKRGGVPYIRFATDGFSESDVNLLLKKLKEMGYDSTLNKCSSPKKGAGLRIALTADSTRKFVDEIKNPIPEYEYKWRLENE